jgi:putative phosphoribosyl transferase
VVDDGIATGSTALVAVRSARDLGASEVILAIPVASQQAVDFLQRNVDRLVVLMTPEPFMAVGLHYDRFDQVTDEEVIAYLKRAAARTEAER